MSKKSDAIINSKITRFLVHKTYYESSNVRILQKILRIFIFILASILAVWTLKITPLIFDNPFSWEAIREFLLSIFILLGFNIFARSTLEFFYYFFCMYLLIFFSIEALICYKEVVLVITLGIGLSIYITIQTQNFLYKLILKDIKLKKFKMKYIKAYEEKHSNFDHASNYLAFSSALLVVYSKLSILTMNESISTFLIAITALYITLIKVSASTMKRNISKLKEEK